MFNCDKCKNRKICKNKQIAERLQKDVGTLKNSYREFYGNINLTCDYYVTEEQGICFTNAMSAITHSFNG